MSMRDPETGQFVSSDGTAPDYSDFRYQHIMDEFLVEDPSGNARIQTGAVHEPLAGRGGLDVNEVAELVYMEVQVSIEFEDETGDQDTPSATELRGTVGINLPEDRGFIDDDGIAMERDDTDPPGEARNATARVLSYDATDDRVLQHFQDRAVGPFDTQLITDLQPLAGGEADAGQVYTKNWRELTGRGPVLDSNDEISVSAVLATGSQGYEIIGNVRVHLVWDVAEVEDSGRAFSVPSDD